MLRTLLVFCFSFALGLSAQQLLEVSETVYLSDKAPSSDRFVALSLPLPTPRQRVMNVATTPTPTATTRAGRYYQWQSPTADSLKLDFRLIVLPLPEWGSEPSPNDTLRLVGGLTTESVETYVLPTMYAPDLQRSALGDAAAGKDAVATVNEILGRLRRVKPVRDPERFNLEQPVLEDFYRRQTTDRRLHLLLSMALQYHGISHRLVAGKILRFGTVLENQLWVEVFAGGRWSRLHLSEPDDYLRENSIYVACSYDFRDFTFEVFGSGKIDWDSRYRETIVDFWEKKDTALLKKDYATAVSYLDSVLYYAPKMLVAVAEKGLVIIEAGRGTEGMRYLQYAINTAKTGGEKAVVYMQLAKYYTMTGELEQAVSAIQKSNRFAPVDLEVLYTDHRFQALRENPRMMRRLGLVSSPYEAD